jgi:starch synthase
VSQEKRTTSKILRVLFIAAEADPIIKVGGLGDVTGSLPKALQALPPAQALGYELDVRMAIPFHSAISIKPEGDGPAASFEVPHPYKPIQAKAFLTHIGNIPLYLISGNPIPRDAPVYSSDTRKDGEKYTFFSLAVLELIRALDWKADIIHAHDWHTAISVYRLATRRSENHFFSNTRSILTIHNLPFMGAGTEEALFSYGIPPLQNQRLPSWGTYQPLPMGLATADYLTTVSPTYAQEILTPEYGCGLQDFLKTRSATLRGILNGLDIERWNPATDSTIVKQFTPHTLERRLENKQSLLREVALPENHDQPLIILISRLDYQKGIDIAVNGLRLVADLPWQAILLGTGDPGIEANARQLEAQYPNRVRSLVRFDLDMSRKLYSGGDILIMPSNYEPCGLTQMIAMRYGCIPVARATGGLRDTILDGESPEASTGFLFEESTPEAFAWAIRRALTAYQEPKGWKARQVFAMQQDFSWQKSAQEYMKIYHELHSAAM